MAFPVCMNSVKNAYDMMSLHKSNIRSILRARTWANSIVRIRWFVVEFSSHNIFRQAGDQIPVKYISFVLYPCERTRFYIDLGTPNGDTVENDGKSDVDSIQRNIGRILQRGCEGRNYELVATGSSAACHCNIAKASTGAEAIDP